MDPSGDVHLQSEVKIPFFVYDLSQKFVNLLFLACTSQHVSFINTLCWTDHSSPVRHCDKILNGYNSLKALPEKYLQKDRIYA